MMKSKEFFSSRDKDKWDAALQIPFLLAHENVNKMENVLLLLIIARIWSHKRWYPSEFLVTLLSCVQPLVIIQIGAKTVTYLASGFKTKEDWEMVYWQKDDAYFASSYFTFHSPPAGFSLSLVRSSLGEEVGKN